MNKDITNSFKKSIIDKSVSDVNTISTKDISDMLDLVYSEGFKDGKLETLKETNSQLQVLLDHLPSKV